MEDPIVLAEQTKDGVHYRLVIYPLTTDSFAQTESIEQQPRVIATKERPKP